MRLPCLLRINLYSVTRNVRSKSRNGGSELRNVRSVSRNGTFCSLNKTFISYKSKQRVVTNEILTMN